jgi:Fur family iron response transcriptional regulator
MQVYNDSKLEEAATEKLRRAGLRPTRQRVQLACLLLDGRDRHVSAEAVQREVSAQGGQMALATIYNCLHQFEAAGLLKRVHAAEDVYLFDTNLGPHHHFLDVTTGELIDMPISSAADFVLPEAPAGYQADSVDIIVRVRPKN